MLIRWPFVRRSEYEAEEAAAARAAGEADAEARKLTLYAQTLERENRSLKGEIDRLTAGLAEANEGIGLQSDEIRDCHEHIARLESQLAASIPAVAPFWLGLPNEVLTLTVHAGAPAITATLGLGAIDEASDDPRVNPSLPFALKPID